MSEAVKLEVLTDQEAKEYGQVKDKSTKAQKAHKETSLGPKQQRIYLILVYTVAFDR
jgi:hypothetical protein